MAQTPHPNARNPDALYRTLFEQASDAIIIFEPTDETILEANRQALKLYGCTRRELVGRSLLTLSAHPAAGRRRVRETLRRGRVTQFESVQYRKDGTAVVVAITAAAIDYHGRRAILSINRDVTQRRNADEALRASERQLRAAREASLDAIYVLRAVRNTRGRIVDFLYTDVNRRGATLVSLRRTALVGRTICQVFPRVRSSGFLAKFVQVAESHRPLLEEFRVNEQGIRAAWIHQQVVPLEDGIMITSRDITAAKQVEEGLRQRENELSEAQRIGRTGSWTWVIETDRVTWTRELFRVTGLDPAGPAPDFAAQVKIFTRESWLRLNRAVQRARRTGRAYELDLEVVRPDGEKRWITARGEAERDARGRVRRLHGTSHDISERMRFEQALRSSEQRLRAAREASLDAFILFASVRDARGRIVDFRCIDANQRGLELAGASREQLIGSRMSERFPGLRRSNFFAGHVRVVETGVALEEEFPMEVPYFNAKWVHHQVVKVGDGFASVTRDITDRKHAEDVLKALPRRVIEAQEAERRRVARELHDGVSQLLASARYRLHALTAGLPAANPLADGAQAAVERALGEVRRISHGLRPSELDDLGLAAALRALVADFRTRTGLAVALQCARLEPRLPADREEACYRIVQEALTNVERHARARRVTLKLTRSRNAVRLVIRDDGRGLPRDGRGSGLGLMHMRERAELTGGTCHIGAAAGGGTEIIARLPLPVPPIR